MGGLGLRRGVTPRGVTYSIKTLTSTNSNTQYSTDTTNKEKDDEDGVFEMYV